MSVSLTLRSEPGAGALAEPFIQGSNGIESKRQVDYHEAIKIIKLLSLSSMLRIGIGDGRAFFIQGEFDCRPEANQDEH